MKNPNKKQTVKKVTDKKNSTGLNRSTKIGIVAAIVAFLGVVGLIFGLTLYNATKPYPLGDDGRVVYLGKEHSGDGIVAPSYDLYYYGTDMTPEELAVFFHASLSQPSGDTRSYDFALSSGDTTTMIFFKDKYDPDENIPAWTKNTTKKNVFYIHDQTYDSLMKSS